MKNSCLVMLVIAALMILSFINFIKVIVLMQQSEVEKDFLYFTETSLI